MDGRPLSLSGSTRVNLAFAGVAVAAAAVIGVLVPISPTLAVAALVAVVAVPAAVIRPRLIPHILVVAVFAESVTIGGVTVSRLMAPLALVAVISQAAAEPIRLRHARLTIGLTIAYVVLVVASLAWTVDVRATFEALGSLGVSLVYMAAFATLVRTRRDLRALMWTFLGASIVLGWLWITQFASGVDRRFNTAGDPNFFAALQVAVLPLIVVLASSQPSPGRRLLMYLAIAIIVDSVISTLSRGGFVTLLMVSVLLVFLPARTLFRTHREKAAFFTAAAIGLAILLPIAWGPLGDRFQRGFEQSHVAGDRGDLWMAALNGYELHPLTGLGYGAFEATSFQLLRVTPGVNLAAHVRFREGEFAHNAYLGSLAELGPLGLLLFMGILGATAVSLRRTARRARVAGDTFLRSAANAVLVGLLAFSASSVLLSTETSRTLWLLVGLSLALAGMDASPALRRPSPEEATADTPA